LQQAGAAMYQAGATEPTSEEPDGSGSANDGRSDEDVVEGEFSDAN